MVAPAALPFPGGLAADCREMLKEKEGVVRGAQAWCSLTPGARQGSASLLCCAWPAWQFWEAAAAAVGLEVSESSCAAVHKENNKAVGEMFSQC